MPLTEVCDPLSAHRLLRFRLLTSRAPGYVAALGADLHVKCYGLHTVGIRRSSHDSTGGQKHLAGLDYPVAGVLADGPYNVELDQPRQQKDE